MKGKTAPLERIKNLGVLFATLLLLFGLLEAGIRCFPDLYGSGYRPSKDERIVFELAPHYKMKKHNATISAQGLNDRIFSLEKPAGVYRIAVVGDSTSFGWKVGPENSYPKILEKLLNQNGQGKYEVINFSVPGYNTAQETALLKRKVINFKPDMVILAYCGNDIHICNYIKPKITPLNFLYNKSHFVHAVLTQIDASLAKRLLFTKEWSWFKKNILGMYYYQQHMFPTPGLEETIYMDDGNPPSEPELVPERYHYMLGVDNYKKHLANFAGYLKRRNIELIVTGELDWRILKINKKLGLKVCNFLDVFGKVNATSKDFNVPENDMHMNIAGHKLCAEALYKMIVDKKEESLPAVSPASGTPQPVP